MDKKVVFLDVDGTIMDFDGVIPESAKLAIKQARANGHEMVVCSGRSIYQIQEEIRSLGFDGIIGGAGAYAVRGDEEIYHSYIPEEKRRILIDYLEKNKFVYMAQTNIGAVANRYSTERMNEIYKEVGLSEERAAVFLGQFVIREDVANCDTIEKVIFHESPYPFEQVVRDLSKDFYITDFSFNIMQSVSGEIGMGGINKSTGIKRYLEHVNLTRESVIAIGDGPNDLEMLEYVGTGIAMGNAIPGLKAVADYITTPINEDGLYNAFKKFKLI